jgi:hypothetical protein
VPPVSVPSITGFVLLFAVTAVVSVVGLLLSLGLRNYRFRADGSRLESPSPAGEMPSLGADEAVPTTLAYRLPQAQPTRKG